ncbi:sigma-54-dependent transcriptional regulator [Nitratidesulfovibrio liaohensis]|uniref:sigma-54-dependent transcriptional regulator n=1 Tax=Nitratidesulfovibrio liaohensis TaxID=2604158 RepID=UPI0014202981|nr:sigma-54 dependent transcriptional regulator [Nitratidesulfovibrio liaohensis]NHZ45267.1 sigma-54-dependent Fis family transcriptional regulator [Nitratidesulfovibrio liaohensis]
MADVLVIDPTRRYREYLVPAITAAGHACRVVSTCEEAVASGRRRACDVVLLDVDTPGPEGLACLPELSAMRGQPEVLALTALRTGNRAEDAIRAGAWDVLLHPIPESSVRQVLERCLYHHAAKVALIGQANIKRGDIIGTSLPLERCLHSLGVAARTDTNVLILGETGTGKELFARAVHENSERAGRGFIVVDCTNLPSTLAESILFGHERGSFTGADAARDGLFKQADGGTIFLDEIGDLDLSVQKSLLRVLQERTFRPISARNEVRSDFRLVAATNCDIEDMVRRGAFRKDLYHRLKTRIIQLPPLRERRDDIEPLARHYVDRICRQHRLATKQMSPDFVDAVQIYHWPGNVRDLINALHYAVQAAFAEQRLYPQHLPVEIRGHVMRARRDLAPAREHEEEVHPPMFVAGTVVGMAETGTGAGDNGRGHGAETGPSGPSGPSGLSGYSGQPGQLGAYGPSGGRGLFGGAGLPGGTGPAGGAGMQGAAVPSGTGGSFAMAAADLHGESGAMPAPSSDTCPPPVERERFGFANEVFPSFRSAREVTMDRMESAYLMELIRRSRGEIASAIALSGLSRARLYELLQKHSISLRNSN